MNFEWNVSKNRQNIVKHNLDFEIAIEIFNGGTLERIDQESSSQEERWLAIGEIEGRFIAVVYTDRGNSRRIISARKATKHEREEYCQEVLGRKPGG